nr:antibiotic biosynthesis monooxygenase family protein [uncultured Cupriavidus sp.]
MIVEIADLRIHAGQNSNFETAVRMALETILSKSSGFRRYTLERSIESTERYVLLIEWDSVEAHTKGFRESPAFEKWREVVGPFFAIPPFVEHFKNVAFTE